MQCGIPVVTSRTAAMPEVAGNAALLIDPLDPADLAAAMSQMLTDAQMVRQWVKHGCERIRKFPLMANAGSYLSLYRSPAGIAANGPCPAP